MNKLDITVLPLILVDQGVEPTIAKRKSAIFGDDDFDPKVNLMVAQWAYNVDDDTWFYRAKNKIHKIGSLSKLDTIALAIGELKFVKLLESEYQALDLADEIDDNTMYIRLPDPIIEE